MCACASGGLINLLLRWGKRFEFVNLICNTFCLLKKYIQLFPNKYSIFGEVLYFFFLSWFEKHDKIMFSFKHMNSVISIGRRNKLNPPPRIRSKWTVHFISTHWHIELDEKGANVPLFLNQTLLYSFFFFFFNVMYVILLWKCIVYPYKDVNIDQRRIDLLFNMKTSTGVD